MPPHQLADRWSFWVLDRKEMKPNGEDYAQLIKSLGTMETVEQFWHTYSWMRRPADNPPASKLDYFCFKSGIRPMWEDKENEAGGKLSIMVKRQYANRSWEELLLAIVGNIHALGDDVCGVAISSKFHGHVLSVWNRNSQDSEAIERMRALLVEVLNIDNIQALEYRQHRSKEGEE